MRALSYLRVSGKGQVDGDGFPRQRDRIAAYAMRHGIEVVGEYRDEGVSGTTELADREGLADLMARLGANGIDLVLVENASRLARDLIVGEVILRELAKHGVRVVAAESGTDLTAEDGDATRKLIRQVLGAVAEFEKSVIVARLAAARARLRRQGHRVEGQRPFGDRPGEAETLERMRSLRRHKRLTYAAIAETLNAEGRRPRHAETWTAKSVAMLLARVSTRDKARRKAAKGRRSAAAAEAPQAAAAAS